MAVVVGSGTKGRHFTLENDTFGPTFDCNESDQAAALILITLGGLGVGANVALMAVILIRKPLRR